ncbi:hypothetical protein B5807_06412 [Epicoccum nigrum]|uniref:Secreted protein n=1 Tax=Epicoccum nigrum TaxID=105696 RepID=A0A1Y2LYT5_EPING|nr:hypothetical protein B5807_06412 [Epicoccum nigrum]
MSSFAAVGTMRFLFSILALFAFALSVHAGITQKDFTGIGNIYVLNSSHWPTASPTNDRIGCLNEQGKLISTESREPCGTFTRKDKYPYTLSTRIGNCTFQDQSQERNTDSKYGAEDHAWNCNATYESDIYDQLYTIDGFPHVFLCFGDVACYYDARSAPERRARMSLWQFHWGSGQLGVTPGHIQLLLMWNKIGETPKREASGEIPGPRLKLEDGLQIPLRGLKRGI